MMRYSAVIVLMVLCTGCMHDKKPETQPPPVATTPETPKKPQPATAAPATGTKKPSSTTKAKPAAKPAPAATAKTTPPATAKTAPPKAATLDLDALETRLKQTKAIGLMTKLSLKNQVDDLLDKFRKHYSGSATPTMTDLRR